MTSFHPRISLILLAGGQGLRMQSLIPKQFLCLREKPIALYSFETLCTYPCIDEIIIVCDPAFHTLFSAPSGIALQFAPPGVRRQDSVFNALERVSNAAHLLCIHDSARPLLLYKDLLRVIEAADVEGAAALAAPVQYTLKECDENACVVRTVDRARMWEIYTPQVMRPALLRQGYALAHAQNRAVTDEMSLIELTGHPVKLVHGSSTNIKVTLPEDLKLVAALLDIRASL